MNDRTSEEITDEGLLDRIVDTLAGKSSKASQHATNLKAFFRGDKDAIGDPEQAENLRKFERNLHRIKEKFDNLIEELGDDLVSAIGIPDEGPFKDVVDEFDTAVNMLRGAIDNIAVKADKIDDSLPAAKPDAKRFSRKDYENKKDNKKDTVKSANRKQNDDYGFDDDGVFRAQTKQQTAADEEATESPDDRARRWRETHAGWEKDAKDAGHETWEEDLAGSSIESSTDSEDERYWDEDEQSWMPPLPDLVSDWDEDDEENDYKSPTFFDDELDQSPNMTENTKNILNKWQKIIS